MATAENSLIILALLLALLFYGYATGVFFSCKIEQVTHDSVAFRFIIGNTHPDHDTIATFRKRFLPALEGLFVQMLVVAKVMGLFKLGKVSLDGTKVKANASKPRGRKPKLPEAGPRDKDQVNFTDTESRIMPSLGGGYVQAYNAQATVDVDSP